MALERPHHLISLFKIIIEKIILHQSKNYTRCYLIAKYNQKTKIKLFNYRIIIKISKFPDNLETSVRRDAIFYTIFQRSPELIFEFIEPRITSATNYRFESVEVKEPTFRIDGVFLPPQDASPRVVIFAEVQFQPDELLYHRFFAESQLYMYRNPLLQDDWYGVIIFPSRNLEPKNTTIHQPLLECDKVRRIYLDELDNSAEQSIGISLMQLTIASENQLVESAKRLIERVKQEESQDSSSEELVRYNYDNSSL